MSIANGSLLSVEAVTKSFEGLRAVNECSLDVKRGTITGLIGPNGAGKTTLFNIVTGFLKPTSGRIVFAGGRIDGLPPHKVFGRGIVRTFQIPRELKQMTVVENLMLVPAGQSGERLWNPWLLPFRVRTLMCDPQLILLDEPGAGVNPTLMKSLALLVERLRDESGITFFLIEHDMDLVARLCNPVIVMSSGEKIAEGTPEEVVHDERVLEAYLGGQYR
jgi:branched-chain amino acid transport system ATP-binding protein